MTKVYVFHGHKSRFANTAFSTLAAAEQWIAKHALTGLVTAYEVDSPAFDRNLAARSLPRATLDAIARGDDIAQMAERYVDGSDHYHFVYGHGESSPGFQEAMKRWEQRNQ